MVWVIEGWRGLAALLVLWAHWGHALGWPMGPAGVMGFAFTGVDLFFVLSGFVFAPQLLGQMRTPLGAYAVRRITRIYPAYLAALAVYVVLAWAAGRPLLHVPQHVLMAHLQTREMAFYYNPAFWSLPAELEFYVLVPVAGWLLARRWAASPRAATGWRWQGVLALLGAALALRMALLLQADGVAQNLSYVLLNHLPGLAVEFLLGVAVWQCARTPWARTWRWPLAAAGLSGWMVLGAVFVDWQQLDPTDWRYGQLGLPAAVCFAAMVLGSVQMPVPPPGSAGARLAAWGGRLSYPVYLLHMVWLPPAALWVQRWGVAAGTALALAALLLSCLALHLAVEEPARRWGRTAGKRSISPQQAG